MKAYTKFACFVFALAATVSGDAAGQITVSAQVDSSKDIYIGESFNLLIVIQGDNKPGQIDLTPLALYNPRSAGNRDISQQSFTFRNGEATTTVVKRYVMSYSLTSHRQGLIQIPSLTVTVDGKPYQTRPLQVNILKPGTTDKLDLVVTLSEQQCYVGQAVILTVKFYRYADIGDFRFNIPVLHSDGFYVENPEGDSGRAKEFRTVHQGRNSVLMTFSKVLIPKKAGKMELPAASVSADVALGPARSRDPFDGFSIFGPRQQYKRFLITAPSLSLNVLPLPKEGRPAGFYGLVGKFAITASAKPTKVGVGDPITLTIKIGGSRYLKPVQWPALEQIPQLADNFKIPSQKSSPTVEGGFKIFTQTIRANNDKVTQIPPIPLPFFDAGTGKYVVAKTESISLEVSPTKILTKSDLEGDDFTTVTKEVEAIKKGLAANYEGPEVLVNQTFSPLAVALSPGYAVLWSLPLASLVISSLIKLFTLTSPEKTASKRRRRACGRTVRELKNVASAPPQQRHELLVSAMKQYVGERFEKVAGSLTADDCREVILAATQDPQTADKYSRTIADCEAARYSSAEANVDATQVKEIAELVRTVEKKSRR